MAGDPHAEGVAAAPPGVCVIGAGPAGLMAAEVLSQAGLPVEVFDAMPSAGRKFLLAGKGGMNLTHSEPFEPFLGRYGGRTQALRPLLEAFGPQALRAWAEGLGIGTFVGTSGRVFPTDMKAAPLLRAWLQRLRARGVRLHMRHRWLGWLPGDSPLTLRFASPEGRATRHAEAVVLALGGASWPRLGSDGAWQPWLAGQGIDLAPLVPANCGFEVAHAGSASPGWSAHLRERHAGQPIKPVVLHAGVEGAPGAFVRQGEFVLTEYGIEGSLVYAASALLRNTIAQDGEVTVWLDLLPDRAQAAVAAELAKPRGRRSFSEHLRGRLGIAGAKAALLHELLPREAFADPACVAKALKRMPLRLVAPRPIAEAISSAGGVRFEGLDEGLMLRGLPGVFCAGEMLDWEAPTGGYLLTACFASGHAAGRGAAAWLGRGSLQDLTCGEQC